MDRTMTVSVRGLLVTAAALLALVTAYLLGSTGRATTPPAQAAPASAAPASAATGDAGRATLRMVGAGRADVVPDQLTFTLSVTGKQPDLDRALDGTSATMRRVLARLRDFGVGQADVQTTGLQMYPEYDYPSYSSPVLTGYRVTQRAQVRITELAQGGKAVAAAVGTGGNGVRVTGIRLGVADPDTALARARDAAVAEATGKAEQYAAAAGQLLGDVVSLRELGDPSGNRDRLVQQLGYRSLAAADGLKEVPIRAGRDRLTVRVQLVWTLDGAAAGQPAE